MDKHKLKKPICECGGNERIALDCTMKPCKYPTNPILMDEIDKAISNYKTFCCGAEFHVKSRANFRCKKCDSDVTIEVMLYVQAETN